MSFGSTHSQTSLLRARWSEDRVRERHTGFANDLVEQGYTFLPIKTPDRAAVETLVNDRLVFDNVYAMAEAAGGIRAVSAAGELAGAIVLEGMSFPDGLAMRVTAIAVEPRHERRGIGTVLLGMAPQLATPTFIYGGCAASEATFYQRAGFDVLQAGAALPFTLGGGLNLKSSNVHYPHWFIRWV